MELFQNGGVLELADRQDLGSCAERREGSSPSFPTNYLQKSIKTVVIDYTEIDKRVEFYREGILNMKAARYK